MDNPEYSNEVNEPGAPAELIPDTPAEPNTNELGQTPDGLELPVPEEEPDDSQDESTAPEDDQENFADLADLQTVQRESGEKAYVLTNDSTGEVVGSWDEGEENDLLTACRLLNQQPCTLTLYRDLTVPGPFYVQNGIALTIQSEQNQKYTLSLKKVSPVTPSDEEISDITQGSNLILKNLTLEGEYYYRLFHQRVLG